MFIDSTILLLQRQYPVPYLRPSRLYSCPYDVLVSGRAQQLHVLSTHQPRVSHDDKVLQRETLHEVIHYRYHRVTLVLAPVEDGIGQRIAVLTDQKPQYYLSLTCLSVLGESCLTHVILGSRLKIKCGDIIEQQPDIATEYPACMGDANLLHQFHLAVIELVHVTVDAA